MQHHLGTNLFKGGVYDPTKTVETFSRGKDRHRPALPPAPDVDLPRGRKSPPKKIDIWRGWKWGQSQHEIGRAYGRPHPTIRKILLPCGGIAPAARRRSRLSLTLAEREDISRGIASDSSIREIARLLKRSASTVSRGVARHGGRPAYRAHDADRRAWVSALRPKR